MRLLLVNTNRYQSPYPVAPIGACMLRRAVQEAGHECRVLDLCFSEDPAGDLGRVLDEGWAQAVALSVRNLDNSARPITYSPVEELEGLAATLGERGAGLPVVLGGAGFSLHPEGFLRHLGLGLGIAGEGEAALPALLDALEKGGDLDALPGLWRHDPRSGRLARGAPAQRLAPERLSEPDWDGVDVQRYYRSAGTLSVQTKRGCPFPCNFCTYPALEGTRIRARPAREVVAELEGWLAQDVRHFFFVDSVFNVPEGQAVELLDALEARGLALRWTSYANPRDLGPRFAERAAATGCDGVELGCDSGSDAVLDAFHKGFAAADIERAVRALQQAGIPVAISLMFGGPGEDARTVAETFALMDRLRPAAVFAMVGVRIYPGVPLEKRARAEGLLAPDHDLFRPAFYISPRLSDRDLAAIEAGCRSRPAWVMPGEPQGADDELLRKLREQKGMKGPLWRLLPHRRQGP